MSEENLKKGLDPKEQHAKISGYRKLPEEDINAMNELKAIEEKAVQQIDNLIASHPGLNSRRALRGKLMIQDGFMNAVRAITKPGGEEDIPEL